MTLTINLKSWSIVGTPPPQTASIGLPLTVPIIEGQTLNVTGSVGSSGTAYLLDPTLGGTNYTKSWPISADVTTIIGPYSGTQNVLIVSNTGTIMATIQNASLSNSGGTGGDITNVVLDSDGNISSYMEGGVIYVATYNSDGDLVSLVHQ